MENLENADLVISTAKKLDIVVKQAYVQSKSFDEIIELAKNKEKMIAAIPAIQPVAIKDFERIGDYFGYRSDPFTGNKKMHEGRITSYNVCYTKLLRLLRQLLL